MTDKPIAIKLAEISTITGDAFLFIKMRELLELYTTQQDDPLAVAMIDVVNKFHRFCIIVEEQK